MPLNYSCFISYTGSTDDLLKPRLAPLVHEIQVACAQFLPLPIAWDRQFLPGGLYNEEIPRLMCQSACLIALYLPAYDTSEYCIREYVAMERIELARRQQLGAFLPAAYGMVVPLILKTTNQGVPGWLRATNNYADITKPLQLTGYTGRLKHNRDFSIALEKVAQNIRGVYDSIISFQRQGPRPDLFTDCHGYFPSGNDPQVVQRLMQPPPPLLPLRDAA